jgi:hypothetical protein
MKKLITLLIILAVAPWPVFCQQKNVQNANDYVEIKYIGDGFILSGTGISYECKINRSNNLNEEGNQYFQLILNIIKNNFSKNEIFYAAPDAQYIQINMVINDNKYSFSSMHPFIRQKSIEDKKFVEGFDSIIKETLKLINKNLAPNK